MSPKRRSTDMPAHRRAVLMPRLAAVATGVLLTACLFIAGTALVKTNSTTHQIQNERARSVRENCEQVNDRHDHAIETLDRLIAKAPPSRRQRAIQNRAATVLLLDAIVPKRDCERLVRQSVDAGR
jgi:hypothetical protein